MNTTIKTYLLIAILLFVSSCSSQASQPGTDSDTDSQEAELTPKAQANDHDEGEASPSETNLIDPACQMEQVFLVVDYDHSWTWSPDGTESTGAYTGWTSGTMNFLLENDKYGNLSADTNTFSFRQSGIIKGSDQCEVDGSGRAEITMSGICQDGVIELEWMEVATGDSEATMTCDKEEFNYLTYYPLQVVMGYALSDEGLGYKSATDTTMPFFRDVHMRWEIRMVPQGQLD